MKTRIAAAPLAALLALAACEVPLAPKWNIDVLFPLQYPDVILQNQVPGGLLPPTNVSFTAPVDSQDVVDALEEIQSQEIDTLRAAVILVNSGQITGTLEISVASVRAALFTGNGPTVATVSLPIRVTTGDTARVSINPGLLQNASRLYFQTRGTMRSNTGGVIALGPADRFSIGVNLTANVKFSK
jgi:hypothetical protein